MKPIFEGEHELLRPGDGFPPPAEACCNIKPTSLEIRTHRFWVRDDFEVEIDLPQDIEDAEIDRICMFLRLLIEH